MNKFALVVYVVIALLAKILGLAFTVSAVLWLLGLFVSSFALAVIATGLMEMIKKGAL